MKLKLSIEPKPISTWGITLASRLEWKEWNSIRQKVFKESRYSCSHCDSGAKLTCHEEWVYDDRRRLQKLLKLVCTCEICHDVKHYGRSTQTKSKIYCKKLVKHWCKINKKSEEDFKVHEAEMYALSRKRADRQYTVKVGRRILV